MLYEVIPDGPFPAYGLFHPTKPDPRVRIRDRKVDIVNKFCILHSSVWTYLPRDDDHEWRNLGNGDTLEIIYATSFISESPFPHLFSSLCLRSLNLLVHPFSLVSLVLYFHSFLSLRKGTTRWPKGEEWWPEVTAKKERDQPYTSFTITWGKGWSPPPSLRPFLLPPAPNLGSLSFHYRFLGGAGSDGRRDEVKEVRRSRTDGRRPYGRRMERLIKWGFIWWCGPEGRGLRFLYESFNH